MFRQKWQYLNAPSKYDPEPKEPGGNLALVQIRGGREEEEIGLMLHRAAAVAAAAAG